MGNDTSRLFGPVDDSDRRRWQHRNLLGLTELVKFGVTKKLPPLFWTLPDIGDICGKFSPVGRLPTGVTRAMPENVDHRRVRP
jgi:hypothetical protein